MLAGRPVVEEAELDSIIHDAPANVEARTAQEAKWVGDYDGRQHWSLRETYGIYKDRIKTAQDEFYLLKLLLSGHFSTTSPLRHLKLPILERIADYAYCQPQAVHFLANWRHQSPEPLSTIIFAARKRPLLSFELEAGEWDSVCVDESMGRVVCHDGRLDRTGRRLEMAHKKFVVDRAYGAHIDDGCFYLDAVKPLVQCALDGTEATMICYGQTGTGKTHTFNACWQRVGSDLVGRNLSVTFFEIHGKKCYDLLQDRKNVALRADENERVHVRGAVTVSVTPSNASDLIDVLEGALRLRKTETTERNPISSRSHAVCVLDIEGAGTLRFVDLAGSERNYETQKMTGQQHRDFVEINKSLMALKECFRQHAEILRKRPGRPAYRASQLTQVLRSCFTDPEHRTLICAMVSPTATDLLHSTNSLMQVTRMSKALSTLQAECVVDLPLETFNITTPIWEWNTEEIAAWIKNVDNGRFKYLVLPPKITGGMLLQLSSQNMADLFETSLRAARGDDEGQAWNESARSAAGRKVGRMFFAAVRKEAMRWPAGAALLQNSQVREDQERQRLEAAHDLPAVEDRHCEFFFWGEGAQNPPHAQLAVPNDVAVEAN